LFLRRQQPARDEKRTIAAGIRGRRRELAQLYGWFVGASAINLNPGTSDTSPLGPTRTPPRGCRETAITTLAPPHAPGAPTVT
jgi:hypothetical protein